MKKYILISILSLLLFSCNDISSFQEEIKKASSENSLFSDENLRINTNLIPTYPLNWETLSYMPHPVLSIRPPWQGGLSTKISNDIVQDYKKQDGWELVYNTFSSTNQSTTLFFALYNKFRGVLRVYYFSKDDISTINSDYIKGTLILYGSLSNSSPILNYVSSSVVDVSEKNVYGSIVTPFLASPNTWYAFEYELAYDSNIASRMFSELYATLDIEAVNITNVNLAGEIDGDLSGQAATSGLSLSIDPNFSGTTTNYNNSIIVNGNSDTDKLKIGTIIKNGLKSGLTSGLAGLASNVLSGLFSKTSSAAPVTKMSVDLNQTLTGTLEDGIGIASITIPFTGTQSVIGNGAYPGTQGVFNVANKPTIKAKKIHQRRLDSTGAEIEPLISYQYELVPGTFNLIWNTSVVPGLGSVSNLKFDVVVSDHASITTLGTKEISGSLPITTGPVVKVDVPLTVVGVRVSFRFNPSNGSNFVFNAKTFEANVIEENVFLPPVGGGEDS